MKSQQVVNDLKLRLSYGRVGNQAIDIYSTQSLFSSGSTILGGQEVVTYTPSKVPSKDLTWEKQTSSMPESIFLFQLRPDRFARLLS